ncbi:TRAM domain-containing protein [Thermogladius sp. KZ2Tp1]|uniref:TRAM domain-containing protein n=1 Tax=unclassified Thermogladius TaxID=2647734 RepID=UPI003D09F493
MSRHQKKHSWAPYTSDVQKFSIYPSIKRPEEERELRVGSIAVLNIDEVDEKGNGIAKYKNVRVIVRNASLGSRVKARILKLAPDYAVAEVVEVLEDSYVDY